MLTKNSQPQRRNRLEIVAEILKIARKGVKKTRIVYGANLNFKMLSEYLIELEKVGLIKYSSYDRSVIQTTEKGRNYLEQFCNLHQFGLCVQDKGRFRKY